MMNDYGFNQGMNPMVWATGIAGLLLWLVLFTDLVLLGVWLYKLINKK